MAASWGLTETAPAATSAHYPITRSDVLGVPLPGVEVALVPVGDKREIRVKGPNVMPGYHRRPDLTEAAFDEEGFVHTGDAVALADPDDVAAGLVFRGRIAEDFKLATGTFVSVGTLRPSCSRRGGAAARRGDLRAGRRLRHRHGLAHATTPRGRRRRRAGGRARAELAQTMERLGREGGGSSQRVERLLVLTEPRALDAGEITDKGYVNQRAFATGGPPRWRAALADPPPAR